MLNLATIARNDDVSGNPGFTTGSGGQVGEAPLPGVSVVIRSYKRPDSLLKILQALATQDHPDFEVVVVEQSDFPPEFRARLAALYAADPRLRLVYSMPLGVVGARKRAGVSVMTSLVSVALRSITRALRGRSRAMGLRRKLAACSVTTKSS